MKNLPVLFVLILSVAYIQLSAQNIGINVENPEALLHIQAEHEVKIDEGFESNSHSPFISQGSWLKLGGSFEGDSSFQTDYIPHGESKQLILDIFVPADSIAVISYAYQYFLFDAAIKLPYLDTIRDEIQDQWQVFNGKIPSGQHQLVWEFIADNQPAAVNGHLTLDAIKIIFYPLKSPVLRLQDGNEAVGKVLSSDNEGNICWEFPIVQELFDTDFDTGVKVELNEDSDDDIIRFITQNQEQWAINQKALEPGGNMRSVYIGKGSGLLDTFAQFGSNVGIGDSVLHKNGQNAINPFDGKRNTAVGFHSMKENTVGKYNSTLGAYSLSYNVSGYGNVAIGSESLALNLTGNHNIAIGRASLRLNSSGDNNLAMGTYSLSSNNNGTNNLAIGNYSLTKNSSGQNNLALGHYTLNKSKYLWNNIAIGDSTLNQLETIGSEFNLGIGLKNMTNLTEGTNNITLGTEVLYHALNSSENIGIGYKAQFNSIDANHNISIGHHSLYENNYHNRMIIIGDSSAYHYVGNTSLQEFGDETIAIGHGSLQSLTKGDGNIALGNRSLSDLFDGYFNIAIGGRALDNLYQGNNNLAIGHDALGVNYTGNENTAIGSKALNLNIGERNIALGHRAVDTLISGNDNIGIGANVLANFTNGSENVVIGNTAADKYEDGRGITAVGFGANQFMERGDWNTAIGHWAMYTDTIIENVTAIGHGAYFGGSDNLVRLGNFMVTEIGGHAGWTVVSDQRFKQNVKEDVRGLSFINALRPVSYQMNSKAFINWQEEVTGVKMEWNHKAIDEKDSEIQYGFLAQEVEQVANELGFDFSGVNAPKSKRDHYTIEYSAFTIPLVKSVQELSTENQELRKELEKTNSELEQIKQQLKTLTQAIEAIQK